MDHITPEESEAEGDLTFYMDVELKFRRQAANAVSKAAQVMRVICQYFKLLDKATLPLLFRTLVCPHLEYRNARDGRHHSI